MEGLESHARVVLQWQHRRRAHGMAKACSSWRVDAEQAVTRVVSVLPARSGARVMVRQVGGHRRAHLRAEVGVAKTRTVRSSWSASPACHGTRGKEPRRRGSRGRRGPWRCGRWRPGSLQEQVQRRGRSRRGRRGPRQSLWCQGGFRPGASSHARTGSGAGGGSRESEATGAAFGEDHDGFDGVASKRVRLVGALAVADEVLNLARR